MKLQYILVPLEPNRHRLEVFVDGMFVGQQDFDTRAQAHGYAGGSLEARGVKLSWKAFDKDSQRTETIEVPS